jgi:hypothetical protein
LKRVPELEFFFDESIEQHDRIERILQELHAERPETPDTTADSPDDEPDTGRD